MKIKLSKADESNVKEIHGMQIVSFKPLLEKYQDYEISPGNEKIERIIEKLRQEYTDYYLIKADEVTVGAIRIVRLNSGLTCRIAPIFILSQFQGNGIAQNTMKIVESFYPNARKWILDTIKQEEGNCYLYEKLGYVKTGKTEVINEKMTIVYYEKITDSPPTMQENRSDEY